MLCSSTFRLFYFAEMKTHIFHRGQQHFDSEHTIRGRSHHVTDSPYRIPTHISIFNCFKIHCVSLVARILHLIRVNTECWAKCSEHCNCISTTMVHHIRSTRELNPSKYISPELTSVQEINWLRYSWRMLPSTGRINFLFHFVPLIGNNSY